MKKMRFFSLALSLALAFSASAGEKLTLKGITSGEFKSKSMSAVRPMADGETYAQISDDGKKIITYSFKTGKQTGVLFDAASARGAEVKSVDGYILSPDGSRILIQTDTKAIYRRSFTIIYIASATTSWSH